MKRRVLFLCTGNSCRSQMAEGFLKNKAEDKFEVFSAGIEPAGVNPLAVKVMRDAGVDISSQRSKSIKEFLGKKFDYVVTVCDKAKQACPVFGGRYEKIHWNLEDPAVASGAEKEKLIIFRKVRDEIERKIDKFIKINL
ncbi:MAG: arsenate reductase ArsC [Candidatus Omnitrophica bacterium]|nr:arsenate reductase ArsC [Candidatus Omnitrophota bacterium]MBD3269075.1 arsenate reductase ArsC [Candidatus Omnitrophota bacterium]